METAILNQHSKIPPGIWISFKSKKILYFGLFVPYWVYRF